MRTHAARAPAVAAPVAAVKPVRAQPTVRAILRTPIQPKLEVGAVNDPLEHEADRVADQVMRMPAPKVSAAAAPRRISRKCAACEEERPRTLQRKAGGPKSVAGNVPAVVHEVLGSPGKPLDDATRAYFEPRFGRDFSQVRVHNGAAAEQSAHDVNARAYTAGHDIVFAARQFAPATRGGRRLLAHELAHIVQQDDGRSSGVVQRREVDDRSCAGLTDIEADIDSKVNSEIGAARVAAGTPISVPAFLEDVYKRLGKGIISPIETFVQGLPASKRNLPPDSLAGTKYSGVEAVNQFYLFQTQHLADVVGPAAKVHGFCVGADKLGHLFDLGYLYWNAGFNFPSAFGTAEAQSTGRAMEIGKQGLAMTGVFSNADQAANLAGWQFYKDLQAAASSFTFAINNYITAQWNEQVNPSFYEPSVGTVVWRNLVTGSWQGDITSISTLDTIKIDLAVTTSGVTGTYETPAGTAKPANKGKITGGTITQNTTTVSGQVPGDPALSATAVTGISIQFDWERGTRSGKGRLDSGDEQTLNGTWGLGSSRTSGGTLKLKRP
jgi:hypothetical protein